MILTRANSAQGAETGEHVARLFDQDGDELGRGHFPIELCSLPIEVKGRFAIFHRLPDRLTELVHVHQRHKNQIEIPTKEEVRAVIAEAKGRWRPLLVTVIFTGMRASELRGLTWDNADLDAGVIHVRQRADRWNVIGSPKTRAGIRDIPLAPFAVNTLREWKLACPKGDLNLVFPRTTGTIQATTSLNRRGFAPVQVAGGVVDEDGRPKFGLHAWRHFAASIFIEQGWTPKKVQTILGHSSIKMTYDTYGHLLESREDDQEAMAQLQARLLG